MICRVEQLSKKIFLPVRMERDVYKAVVHKYKEIEAGQPEVELVSALGYKMDITKYDLMNNFSLINGRRIKMLGVTCNKPITVVGTQAREMRALYITNRDAVQFSDGKPQASGKYIICELDSNGQADLSKNYVVSKQIFQKLFVMSGDINKLLEDIRSEVEAAKQAQAEEEANSLAGLFGSASAEMEDVAETEDGAEKEDTSLEDLFAKAEEEEQTREQETDDIMSRLVALAEEKRQREQRAREMESIVTEQSTRVNQLETVSKITDTAGNVKAIRLKWKTDGRIERVELARVPEYIEEYGVDGLTMDYSGDKPTLRFVSKGASKK